MEALDFGALISKGDLLAILAWVGIAILVHALFLSWGAAVAGIKQRGFGRALVAAILSVGAMAIVAMQASRQGGSSLLAYGLGFVFDILLVMPIFATFLRRAAAAVAVARASLAVALLTWWLVSALLSSQGAGSGALRVF